MYHCLAMTGASSERLVTCHARLEVHTVELFPPSPRLANMNGATNVLHTFDQVTASAWLSYHQQNAKQAESIDELLDAMSQQHASSSTRSLGIYLFIRYRI